jgi:phosphopantetheine adenylyltransferase
MIKEIAHLGGDISRFVPREVLVALQRKLAP